METILHATPGNPLPELTKSGHFIGHRGVRLRYAVFKSPQPTAKGTIVLLQGRNESIEKYFETIHDLTQKGFWVAAFDLRGQGGSDRLLKDSRKGHVGRFDHYVRDLEIFLETVVLPDTRLPFYLLAHSTGGLIALKAAPRLANRIERMVLTAPFVGLGGQIKSQDTIRRLAMLATFCGLGSRTFTKDQPRTVFDGNPLTSDPQRFARNRKIVEMHPELELGQPTARWIYEAQKAIAAVRKPGHLASITVPTVIIAPGNDSIVPFAFQESLAQYFRAGQLVPVPGARHEILQEKDRYRVQALAALFAFMPGGEPDENAASGALSAV